MRKIVGITLACACHCTSFVGLSNGLSNAEGAPVYEANMDLQGVVTPLNEVEAEETPEPVEVALEDVTATGATVSAEEISFVDANSGETVEGEFIKNYV